MFLFLPKTEFQSNYGKFQDIPRLTIDSVFIGQYRDSVSDSVIVEIMRPYTCCDCGPLICDRSITVRGITLRAALPSVSVALLMTLVSLALRLV